MPSFRVSQRTAILALIASIPAPETGSSVFTSPPAAGGSVTITYDALGNAAGDHPLVARMTSDVTAGTTVQKLVIGVS